MQSKILARHKFGKSRERPENSRKVQNPCQDVVDKEEKKC